MAPAELEFGMGTSVVSSSAATNAYLYGLPSTDTLRIDDLLDLSNQELFTSSAAADTHILPPPPPPPDYSAAVAVSSPFAADATDESCHHHCLTTFPDDLYIPSEEAAELEWLSKFVEDSFSDVPYPPSGHLLAASASVDPRPWSSDPSVPARARTKRSKSTTTTSSSSHHHPNPTTWSSSSTTTSSSSSSDATPTRPKKKEMDAGLGLDGGVRKCTHCASEKTPQWRTGPLGPKTLCNACGVRYKSGRLVPEYRPAASPTFLLTQHSNSHRKVIELRRQKELLIHRHGGSPATSSSSSVAASASPEFLFHDYEVC